MCVIYSSNIELAFSMIIIKFYIKFFLHVNWDKIWISFEGQEYNFS